MTTDADPRAIVQRVDEAVEVWAKPWGIVRGRRRFVVRSPSQDGELRWDVLLRERGGVLVLESVTSSTSAQHSAWAWEGPRWAAELDDLVPAETTRSVVRSWLFAGADRRRDVFSLDAPERRRPPDRPSWAPAQLSLVPPGLREAVVTAASEAAAKLEILLDVSAFQPIAAATAARWIGPNGGVVDWAGIRIAGPARFAHREALIAAEAAVIEAPLDRVVEDGSLYISLAPLMGASNAHMLVLDDVAGYPLAGGERGCRSAYE